MSALLRLLAANRNARRDAALARVQAAMRGLDAARQAQGQCDSALQQARGWQHQLRDAPRRPDTQDWQQSRQLSCLALAERAAQELIASHATVSQRAAWLQEQRAALAACERALLRTDEMARIVREARCVAMERQEQADADDLVRPQAKQA